MNLNNLKELVALSITFVVSVMLVALMIFNSAVDAAADMEQKLQDQVGKEVVINKDTLEVVDYSLFNQNLHLSNGTQININYLKENDN